MTLCSTVICLVDFIGFPFVFVRVWSPFEQKHRDVVGRFLLVLSIRNTPSWSFSIHPDVSLYCKRTDSSDFASFCVSTPLVGEIEEHETCFCLTADHPRDTMG